MWAIGRDDCDVPILSTMTTCKPFCTVMVRLAMLPEQDALLRQIAHYSKTNWFNALQQA